MKILTKISSIVLANTVRVGQVTNNFFDSHYDITLYDNNMIKIERDDKRCFTTLYNVKAFYADDPKFGSSDIAGSSKTRNQKTEG